MIERTFAEALAGSGHGLVLLDGGQHLAPCHPHNPALGRGFLEPEATDASSTRTVLADLLVAFARRNTGGADELDLVRQQHATTITHMELK